MNNSLLDVPEQDSPNVGSSNKKFNTIGRETTIRSTKKDIV